MRRIGVLTSGGDAPGMNAAIRAVVRTGIDAGCEVFGIRHGFRGLIEGQFEALGSRDVGNILQRGGTMLGSARCKEFKEEASRKKALRLMAEKGIEGLIVIGGNGTQTGAHALTKMGFPVVGVASTIDNDLVGSDVTIGVDTALNIALESIDRLKVTASSHERAFLVEVMGRDCGYLALMAGLAGGAETVVIPEAEMTPEALAADLAAAYERGKTHALVVVAEGALNNADKLFHHFQHNRDKLGFDLRITKLGHVQRGGTPVASDRILATRLGHEAVKRLVRGEKGVLVGILRNELAATPLEDVAGKTKSLDPALLELVRVLAK